MKTQTALEPQAAKTPETPLAPQPLFVEAEQLFTHMKELTQSVAHRAYEFFEERGRVLGHELEDWFRAESELTRQVPFELTENATEYLVRAEVPGFKPDEIKVSVEPHMLVVSGKAETETIHDQTTPIYSDRRTQQFCRTFTLPTHIEPPKVVATLQDGILLMTLPKVAEPDSIEIEVKAA